jgi:hypothetical protein
MSEKGQVRDESGDKKDHIKMRMSRVKQILNLKECVRMVVKFGERVGSEFLMVLKMRLCNIGTERKPNEISLVVPTDGKLLCTLSYS